MKLLNLMAMGMVVICTGCSAISATPQAQRIMLVKDKPTAETCEYMGEAIGSQGDFLTGNFTDSDKLMEGARNDLRNKASAMGGNTVHVQNITSSQADESLGTTNTLVVGHVYRC